MLSFAAPSTQSCGVSASCGDTSQRTREKSCGVGALLGGAAVILVAGWIMLYAYVGNFSHCKSVYKTDEERKDLDDLDVFVPL
jgi:hypothetical protein